MDRVKPGKYLHYKGAMYEVFGVARHSETLEEFVLYKQLHDSPKFPKGTLWVRPKKMFLEKVEVNGQTAPRFSYVKK